MSDVLEGLNEAQRAAVMHAHGPLLIVAGAGTGKTTVLTRRYVQLLISQGLSADNLLALTFTEKAAAEMEDRVIQQLPTGTYDFWISTFHGFCQRVLQRHGLEIGLPNEFRLLTPTDGWLLLRRHLDELPLDHYRPAGHPIRFLNALLKHISRAKDEGVTAEAYQVFAQNVVLDGDSEVVDAERKRLQELADAYAAYQRLLLQAGCLDFGDLILQTLRLFRERPSVLNLYRKQFPFLMVDEFQDTNWAQYELLKLVCGPTKNLTVVGDDDQAIYKFRGASLANILQFREDFPDTKTVALTENYRSRAEILAMAYRCIHKNDPNRLEVRLRDTGLSKELHAVRGAGGVIDVSWLPTMDDEAETVIRRFIKLKHDDPELSWNDFAILARANHEAEPFVSACERLNVPYQFLASRGLYTKGPILDLVAMLKLLDGYHEASAVWRVMNAPCYRLPARDQAELLQLASRQNNLSIWLALKQEAGKLAGSSVLSDAGLAPAKRLIKQVEDLADLARRETPVRVLQTALEQTGYLAAVMRLQEQEKRETIQWLNAFAERIKRYERSTHGASMRGFLEEFFLEIESGAEGGLDQDPEAGPELLKIMTVHKAKGLEFKHVAIVALVDQRFPTRARSEALPLPDGLVKERLPEGDQHLEEERRLFYVAVTRAKDSISLSGASDYGGTRVKKPSVFIEESGLAVSPADAAPADQAKRLRPPEDELLERNVMPDVFPLKRRFSFTQLAAFRRCPLQYKFAHVYRIPVLGKWQKNFGNSMHLAFQHIMELHLARAAQAQPSLFAPAPDVSSAGFRVTEEEAVQVFEADWQDGWYDSSGHQALYKNKGRQAVRNFWRRCRESVPDVLEVEQAFNLVLGQHSIKGKIDRIDRLPDGRVAVIDYKTGAAKDALDAEAKEQLYLYQIALEERGLRVGRLTYAYVLDDAFLDVNVLTEKTRATFLTKLVSRMDDLLSSDFQATPEPFTCRSCDFKSICEFKKV